MKNIKLNDKITVNLSKLIESRMLIQANSGGGKSWAIRRIIEQAFGAVQIIVIDPEGEFANMREEFDFVYVGKDGDAPAESRSAALLAHRLLELKASAIIDLYELPPQERKHFVRLFCEAMVNAPKNLWHDALVIIDEAHIFAPEKGESEAMGAVIDLATRGRKRGYCAILATQRISKLNKDAAAECNNKLIGRTNLDIDRKRSAEELGFTTKEDVRSLRDLDPGEFYVFGSAISRDVVKAIVGDVKCKPPKRGVARRTVPAPSAQVKKILSKLADLPAEAAQEAQTTAELKAALGLAKRRIGELERAPKTVVAKEVVMGVSQWMQYGEKYGYADFFRGKMQADFSRFKREIYQKLLKSHGNAAHALESLLKDMAGLEPLPTGSALRDHLMQTLPEGMKKVLGVLIAAYPDEVPYSTIEQETNYQETSRRTYLQRLGARKLVVIKNGSAAASSKLFD